MAHRVQLGRFDYRDQPLDRRHRAARGIGLRRLLVARRAWRSSAGTGGVCRAPLLALMLLLVGCRSLTADAERVGLTRNPDDVRACTSPGILHSFSLWDGQSGVYIGHHNNLLLLKEMRGGLTTHSVGEADRCGPWPPADP
jgi:hypothetical protein